MTDNLHIKPLVGGFDLDEIRDWLDTRPDVFQLPSGNYRVGGVPVLADLFHRHSLEGRHSLGTFVSLSADEIAVTNEGSTESLRSVIEFLEWLTTRYETRIGTAWGGERDISDWVSQHGIACHYPEGIRSTDLPWKKQLLEIGFFDELPHGHSTSVTLEQAQRATPIPEEQELIAYLSSGRLYRAGEILIRVGTDDALGPAHLFTDGKYLWPADLPWHVQRDHVRLPRHFLIHARANGWRVPEVDLGAVPGSENIAKLTESEVAWYTRPVQRSMPEGETCSLDVAHGLATTTVLLRSGAADAVYRGYTGRGTRVLVTLTMRHDDKYDDLADRLRFELEGVSPLLHVGEVDPASNRGFRDVLVEVEPRGRSILDVSPLPESAAIRCGIDAAAVLASAREQSIVLGGLAPDVIYVDDDLRFTGLTPRSRRFVANVDLRSGGLRSYRLPYSGHEALVLGRGSEEEGDVFALCASLFHAVTGKHPFGSELPEILQRIAAATPLPYPGLPAFGAILASGLVSDPARRPSALELATALARCAD